MPIDPTSPTADPFLAELLDLASRRMAGGMWVCCPGVIVAWTPAAGAVVQPLPQRQRQDPTTGALENYLPAPIPGVPVLWGGGPTGALTFAVLPGTECLLHFVDRSIDEYKVTGVVGALVSGPASPRRFAKLDAIAVIGAPNLVPLTSYLPTQFGVGATVLTGVQVEIGDPVLPRTEPAMLGAAFSTPFEAFMAAVALATTAAEIAAAAAAFQVAVGLNPYLSTVVRLN